VDATKQVRICDPDARRDGGKARSAAKTSSLRLNNVLGSPMYTTVGIAGKLRGLKQVQKRAGRPADQHAQAVYGARDRNL
jgi:hypothetical protein